MSNILLVNDNVQDYQTIIDACKDNTYAVTYNQVTDTYDSIFKKYENIVLENNIQIVNHLALVSHGSNNPEFTFLEKENKMLISQYLPNLSNCASCQTNETEDNDLSLNNIDELFDNTFDIHKFIVDLSLNITQEEFDTKETYTYEEIICIFKDVSNNVFDTSLYDISGDESYPMPFVYDLIKNTDYAITNTSQEETFDVSITDLSVNTPDIHKYIVDLSLNITQEEFNTKDIFTNEDIHSIFKDVSNNVFDMVASFIDISEIDVYHPMTYVYELIKNIHYTITNTSQEETFDVSTTDLSVNTPDIHKYIVDLSLNLTQEEFNTKDIFTNEDIHSIFKDVSHNVFDTLAPFTDISDNEFYTRPLIYTLIEDIYYTITDTSRNEDVLSDTSSNEYILNTLDTWSTFKEFIKKFNIQTSLDFLGCALLQSSDWKYTLETLETEQHLHLNIRASDDDTGNLKVGADWVLETDNVNIKELYFDGETIEKWYYTLTGTPFYNISTRTGWSYGGVGEPFIVTGLSGEYIIEARGGKGGDWRGTASWQVALIKGTFTIQSGESLKIIIGSEGLTHNHQYSAGGGGGGTFVVKNVSNPTLADVLVIAGGSGGQGASYTTYALGPSTSADLPSANSNPPQTGGGSSGTWNSGGGGGFSQDGAGTSYAGYHSGGKSFTNGGRGGHNGYSYYGTCSNNTCSYYYSSTGGYGGGGGSGAHTGGGGGGLYGGNAGNWSGSGKNGRGGGSYNNGRVQVNTLVTPTGPAYVKITGPFYWPTTSLAVPQTDIKFSHLYVALLNNGTAVPGSYSNISFTSIRNTLTFPFPAPSLPLHLNQISIGTDFKGRDFYREPITLATGGETHTYNGKQFHTFRSSGNFNMTRIDAGGPFTLYYLIVGGGGGGGDRHGGGGGGGGVLYGQTSRSGGLIWWVSVGAGGAGGNYETNNSWPRGSGVKGGNSYVSSIGTAYGGGGGGTFDGNPTNSPVGSGGGGGGHYKPGVSGTSGQGNSGGGGYYPAGGGGGGAGGSGGSANNGYGGTGYLWIDNKYYGGGGGGSRHYNGGVNYGGAGGGGNGVWDNYPGTGVANTGGGGGATRSSNTSTYGASGGSGVVILAYDI